MSTLASPSPLFGRSANPPAQPLSWWLAAMLIAAGGFLLAWLFPGHPWGWLAAALILLLSLVGVLVQPAWGAYALILVVYWNASDVLTDSFGFSWLLRLILLWSGVGLLLWRLRPHPGRWRWPLAGPLALWGAVGVISLLHAASRLVALDAMNDFLKAFTVFYLVVNLLPRERQWRSALDALLLAVLLLSLPVVVQGITGTHFDFWGFATQRFKEILPGSYGWRPGGALGDPNFLALVLVAAVPIAAVLALEASSGWPRRVFALVTLGAALMATAFTYSRAALLCLAAVAVLLLWRHPRRRLIAGVLTVVGLAAVLALPTAFWLRMASLQQFTGTSGQAQIADSSFRQRAGEVRIGWLMFEAHPLLGVGPGNYAVEYQQYAAEAGLNPSVTHDPHNLYLQLLAETGILGLASFLVVVWAALAGLWRARKQLHRLGAHAFARLCWGVEFALESYLLFSFFLHSAYFRHFALLLALAALVPCLVEEARDARVRLLARTSLGAAGAGEPMPIPVPGEAA